MLSSPSCLNGWNLPCVEASLHGWDSPLIKLADMDGLLHQAVCICMDNSFYLPPNLHVSDMSAIGSRAHSERHPQCCLVTCVGSLYGISQG